VGRVELEPTTCRRRAEMPTIPDDAGPAVPGVKSPPLRNPPIFGREGEVALLKDLLERVAGGIGALVVLEGGAGIGKSSLVREVLHRSDVRGFQVFMGGAEELQRRRPFAGLTAALGVDGVAAGSSAARKFLNRVLQTWALVHAHRR
jgi:hypothetical protein